MITKLRAMAVVLGTNHHLKGTLEGHSEDPRGWAHLNSLWDGRPANSHDGNPLGMLSRTLELQLVWICNFCQNGHRSQLLI